jgi:hypothetical protein
MHAAVHPLTPGSPAYAIAKVSAIGGLIALRVAMSRRAKRSHPDPEPVAETDTTAERTARAHPVSARKARRRSRKRR